ncbi:MAG: hypothetical protein ACUVQ0_00040 [Thermoproteota archaeon]
MLRESLTDVELISYDLDKIVRNLKRKDSEYLEKIALFLEKNDHERARTYAQEIAVLRKLAKEVYQSSLLILTIKLRLETLVEFEELYGMIPQLVGLLSTVNELNPLPSLQKELKGVRSKLEEASSIITQSTDIASNEADIDRIIKEAEELALIELERTFPKVPQGILKEENKQRLYEYIKANPSSFNIEECAKKLSLDKSEIERLLEELEKDGKIIIGREEEHIS